VSLRDQAERDAVNLHFNSGDWSADDAEVMDRDGEVRYIDVRVVVNHEKTQRLPDGHGSRNELGCMALVPKADYPDPKTGDKIKVPDEENEGLTLYGVADRDPAPGEWLLTVQRYSDEEITQEGARR